MDSFSELKSARFQKYAHVHRAARKLMAAVLDADNYDSLRMGRIEKTQPRQLHDQINEQLDALHAAQAARAGHRRGVQRAGAAYAGHRRGGDGRGVVRQRRLGLGAALPRQFQEDSLIM